MGYESLKSTQLLASHCAVCARPLRDAVSVELGIGPDCRRKHGYDSAITEENRAEANRLIYLIADAQTGIKAIDGARALKALGFTLLADRIVSRLCEVRIEQVEDRFRVWGPYTENAVRELSSVPGRAWNREDKCNTFPVARKNALWGALKRAYPGYTLLIPSGDFIEIPR